MQELETASGGDDLRASLEAAFDAPSSEPVANESAPLDTETAAPPAIDGATDGRPRDELGRFAPKPEQAAESAAPKIPDQGQTAKPEPAPQAIQPPQSWSAEAKALWNSLPPAIQQEAVKRESDYSKGIEQKSLKAKEFERYESLLAPRAQAWAQRFGSPERGLQTLIEISENASRDPEGFVRWFAQNSGLDLARLIQAQADQPPPDPRYQALERQVNQLTGVLTAQQQAQQQAQLNSLASIVDAFGNDPANEHWQSVAPEVLNIIPLVRQSMPHGTPQEVLKEAYDRTIWATPGIRTQLLAKQSADAQAQSQQAAKAQADKSRAAAVSLTGAPPTGAAPPGDAPAATLREELERQFGSRI
jgi:hypothetical protein